jgi:hypothetical protein
MALSISTSMATVPVSVSSRTSVQSLAENILRTGLGEKSEDVPFVDSGDGSVKIRLSGKQDSDSIGREPFHVRKQLYAVHVGHLKIGDHNCVCVLADGLEGILCAGRNLDSVRSIQAALQCADDPRIVVYE